MHSITNESQERELRTPSEDCPSIWLQKTIKDHELTSNTELDLPLKENGKKYSPDDLFDDQKAVVGVVMDKIREWLESDDLTNFQPLRLIINGAGGSGKSVVINTIVTLMREMFCANDVVKVAAPTGTAAFNVTGETLHRLMAQRPGDPQYKPNSMSRNKRMLLVQRFKTLLALIIDERSLVASKLLGTSERMIAETIFEGGQLRNSSWGGLPVLLLVGDDFQLPSQEDGPLQALFKKSGGKIVEIGRRCLLECAEHVMDLKGSKRIKKKQKKDKALMARLRTTEDVSEEDVKKLLSLRLDNIAKLHGEEYVRQIEERAVYMFFRNDKRITHNIERIIKNSSKDNPVAICKTTSSGPNGKGDRRHFKSKIPSSTQLCIGARVAIEKFNFQPTWGLHNGAMGMVEEIMFDNGQNPNHGDLPKYVVVNFPLYRGPSWDKNSPKVRTALVHLKYRTSIGTIANTNTSTFTHNSPSQFPRWNSDVNWDAARENLSHCVFPMREPYTNFKDLQRDRSTKEKSQTCSKLLFATQMKSNSKART